VGDDWWSACLLLPRLWVCGRWALSSWPRRLLRRRRAPRLLPPPKPKPLLVEFPGVAILLLVSLLPVLWVQRVVLSCCAIGVRRRRSKKQMRWGENFGEFGFLNSFFCVVTQCGRATTSQCAMLQYCVRLPASIEMLKPAFRPSTPSGSMLGALPSLKLPKLGQALDQAKGWPSHSAPSRPGGSYRGAARCHNYLVPSSLFQQKRPGGQ
jgi:hypothetical protein